MTTITDVAIVPNRQAQRARPAGSRLVRTQSTCQKPPPPSSSSSSSTSRNLHPNGLNKAANEQPTISQATRNPISVLGKEKFVLKRANSFVSNYSRHLGVSKAQLARVSQARVGGPSAVPAIGRVSSVSGDSTPEIELRPPDEMLIVRRDPFAGFAESYGHLVFLDLYDNQIERISTLDGLRSLTVLLLGKNRIADISGIVSVRGTLRVLDLHGNKITSIAQKIAQLQELRSLNLAGNGLKQIGCDDFKGLTQLKELNLKRNKIRKINGFDDLRSLERFWLCHNDLQKIEDMASVAKAINLKEITVDNNPVSLGGDCVSFLVSYLPSLALLSQMHVTEQVRRAAVAWRRNKEQSDASYSHLSSDVSLSMRREEVISNARTNWELLRSQQPIGRTSQFIYKSLNNSAKKSVPMATANGESDAGSVLSENVIVDRKMIRQKTQVARKQTKRPVTSKPRRSVSIDRLPPEPKRADDPKDVRLPPISITIPDADVQKENEVPSGRTRKPEVPRAPEAKPSTKPMPAEQAIEVSNDEASNLSSFSSRAAAIDEKPPNAPKCRTANQPRRALSRAQTAKPAAACPATAAAATPTATTANPNATAKVHKPVISDREREQGGDYLIEICGRYLNVYGSSAVKFVDRQWNAQKAADVHTIKFTYVNFNNLAAVFGRLKARFAHADNFVFRDTNIEVIGQLNLLAELQGIVSLTIDADGNPICEKQWRSYAVYRLTHWGLKVINDVAVSDEEIARATAEYQTLSDLVLWSLPDAAVEPLLARLHFDESCASGKVSAKQWLMTADESLRAVVSKEALQWKSNSHADQELRKRGKRALAAMAENTFNAVHKLQQIDSVWQKVLLDVIKRALDDYSSTEAYQRRLMRQIELPSASTSTTKK